MQKRVKGRASIVQAVAVDVPRLSAVEAEVVALLTIVFHKGSLTIHRESHRGVARV